MENATLKIDLKALYNNARFLLDETGGGVIATVKITATISDWERAVTVFLQCGNKKFCNYFP